MAVKPPNKKQRFTAEINEKMWAIVQFYEEEFGRKNVLVTMKKQLKLLKREL